jgi:hypothetical protein
MMRRPSLNPKIVSGVETDSPAGVRALANVRQRPKPVASVRPSQTLWEAVHRG